MTGIPFIEKPLYGRQEGEVIIIGGRPCIGKTMMALNIARNASVDYNVPTAYFSLELPTKILTDMLMAVDAPIPDLDSIPLYFNDTPCLKPEEFIEHAKELINKHKVKLFVVDYLQLMYVDSKVYPTGYHYKGVEENLRSLKIFAKENNVAVIVISLMGRAFILKNIPPGLSDLEMYCPSAWDYADKIILLDWPNKIYEISRQRPSGFARNDRESGA